jgi:hypothetical protein
MRLIFLLLPMVAFTQTLKGRVVDAHTRMPLVSATVFMAQSTIKTLTDADGAFQLSTPAGSWQLVVTHVGYEPVVIMSHQFVDLSKTQVIPLTVAAAQIREVTVMSAKDREHYRRMFRQHLLGTSRNAEKSKIKNEEVIYFDYNPQTKVLEAYADEPLVIEIPALNYRVEMVLSSFTLDWKANLARFVGYASYEELLPERSVNVKRITRNRNTAFYGSSQHFLQSLYNRNFETEGFRVRSFAKRPNPDYVGGEQRKRLIEEANKTVKRPEALANPEYLIKYNPSDLALADFVRDEGDHKVIFMDDHLEVTYHKDGEENRYAQSLHRTARPFQVSQFKAFQPVAFYPDGTYHDIDGLVIYGYMGWKKLSDMVPFDFSPTKD